jgi:hypothetical protein
MSGNINSFDEVVATTSVSNRLRSDLTWYGKVEIGANNEVNVEVLLYFPSLSRPPADLFVFKIDRKSNDLVSSSNLGGARVEEKGSHQLEVYQGTIQNRLYMRFSKLDQRLGETFLVSEYRKKLLQGLNAQQPEAIRWAVLHGLPVWCNRKKDDFDESRWEQVTLPYVPFKYEKRDPTETKLDEVQPAVQPFGNP